MKKYPRIGIIYGAVKSDAEETLTVLEEDIVPYSDYESTVEERMNGELCGKGLYLPDIFEWEIVRDSDNQVVLVATRKPEPVYPYPPLPHVDWAYTIDDGGDCHAIDG